MGHCFSVTRCPGNASTTASDTTGCLAEAGRRASLSEDIVRRRAVERFVTAHPLFLVLFGLAAEQPFGALSERTVRPPLPLRRRRQTQHHGTYRGIRQRFHRFQSALFATAQ